MIVRRTLLGAAAGLAAGPALALRPADAPAWIDYERRLRARLTDAGGGAFDGAMARDLLGRTNAARAKAGAVPLRWDPELAATARAHAADLAGRAYVEHLTPDGFDPGHRLGLIARTLIGSASENIAYRRSNPRARAADLMATWRRSGPHWANLLRASHSQAGFGVAVRGQRTYAVGLYANPNGRLGAPLPFLVRSETELAGALRGSSPALDGISLTDPVDERTPVSVLETAALKLAPGVYQLRPRRRVEGQRFAVYWGPIFVRA